jgi:hypothetical protein
MDTAPTKITSTSSPKVADRTLSHLVRLCFVLGAGRFCPPPTGEPNAITLLAKHLLASSVSKTTRLASYEYQPVLSVTTDPDTKAVTFAVNDERCGLYVFGADTVILQTPSHGTFEIVWKLNAFHITQSAAERLPE